MHGKNLSQLYRLGSSRMSHFKRFTIVIFAGLFFISMYEGIRLFTHTPSYILPSIKSIFYVFIADRKTLFENFLHTFYVWFFGKWNRLKEAIGIKENKNASIEVS